MGTFHLTICLCAVFILFGNDVLGQKDVVLLLDSTDNGRSHNFDEEKRFASAVTERLFDPNVRIGLFTFGQNTYSQFTLDMYSNIRDMKQAILYMWYSTGNGPLEKAINTTIYEAFKTTNGDRICVSNTLLILSHSGFANATLNEETVKAIERKKVQVFVINMAGQNARDSFVDLTKNESRVVDASNWNELQSVSTKVSELLLSDVGSTGCGRLTQWESWTGCSRTCGHGFTFRTRQCHKDDPLDQDCDGEMSEHKECFLTDCTEPVEGKWAFWGDWGSCSKTCGTGSQQRTRTCTQPAPANGGKVCTGNSTQTRLCADYKCPDCNATCPAGAHRSQDCKLCECSSLTLYGQALNDNNETVKNAGIYLESSMYSPLATTDEFGLFEISGVCLMNERVFITAEHCADAHITPIEVNATHWTLPNFRLEVYVPPVFNVLPEAKIRMAGQNLVLCCKANGKPSPSNYKWYKDEMELGNVGMNGTLAIEDAKIEDSGKYKCSTETDAGISQSHNIDVTITANASDTCGMPLSKLETLPTGCVAESNNATVVDVRTCGSVNCMTSTLHDNGSCSDYWPHHCCSAKDVQQVRILCEGFSYITTTITSCECKQCFFKSVVTGRAFGRIDGIEVPLQLGEIIINGKIFAQTSMAGFFKFELSKGIRRIVATFHDETFKKFADVTKIIQIKEGSTTFATIVVPPKPTPLPFHADNGTEIHLGGSADLPPAAKLAIQPNSIVTPDGKPFKGKVQAALHFVDPRKRNDIEAANGEFESEAPDGSKVPLKTFGMFQLGMTDENGTDLSVNKPLKFSLDASLFDVPVDENGDPLLALWTYDSNKGTWVEIAKMRKEITNIGGRKLLGAGTYVVDYHPRDIPRLSQFNERVERKIIGYTNCDHSVPIYETTVIREPRAGACFVSVSVYTDLSLKEAYDGGDVAINTYVQDPHTLTYLGYTSTIVLKNGHACIPIFCQKRVYIHVVRNSKERFYTGKHFLPHPGVISQTKDNEILFVSNDFGSQFDKSSYDPNTIFKGPVFQLKDENMCGRLKATDKHFTFKFAPFTKSPTLHFANGPLNFNKKLAWYPMAPSSTTFRSCYMKVLIKMNNTYGLRVIAKSYLEHAKGDEFGSHDVGPNPDPKTDNKYVRGACFEFRCPGLIHIGDTKLTNLSTAVEVRLVGLENKTCQIRNNHVGSDVQPIQQTGKGAVGFTFIAEAGNNYGPKYGVFVADKPAKETEQYCNSGVDSGSQLDGIMNPLHNPAVEFECS
ncbi:cartilage intermediate layer protein 1-like isoform X2 [Mya arenaria]|uniref:cartilage intermediate layer protein 1-like isoform X2 n=1 Tax=Mya arenaria TaxID=6604 RepID=UPI0022E847D1|nr:cartilage intermediate layer protein 1-like isoform X2 [Mya arenaria]